MTKKILLIDDHPEEKFGSKSLEEIIRKEFSDKYIVQVEKNPLVGQDLPRQDKDIEVVLLDIMFNGDPYGNEAAKNIFQANDKTKIVVLTTINKGGKKTQLRQKKNVWYYFVKEELSQPGGADHLKHVVNALIEDPDNEKWSISLDDADRTVTLRHSEFGEMYPFTLASEDQFNTLARCLETPNECFDIVEIDKTPSYFLPKVVSALNRNLLKYSKFRTWGFIDSKGCANNQLKIRIGRPDINVSVQKNPGIIEEIRALRNEIEGLKERLSKIERGL
jgi:CheY-like chemotaxis protein